MRKSIIALAAAALALAGCGSSTSGLPSTSANVTVCQQWNAFQAANGPGLIKFENQWSQDFSPSAPLDVAVTAYLSLMESGGWEPGSGEQTQTAQAAVSITNLCTSV